MNKIIKIKKITDIVHKMDEYLQVMRGMEHENVMSFVNDLENQIKKYFSDDKIDELELKKETAEMVDELYIKLMELEARDVHTDGYFGIILNRLFYELAQKKIYAFFVIDNTIRDDRFKLLIELFATAHFEVIYPYHIVTSEYSQNYTRYTNRDFNEIENQIDEAKKQKKHILYVEKDDSVNYLTSVLQIGDEFQNEYICIFRNKSIEEQKNATWLMGSFGEILESQKPKSLEEINEWAGKLTKNEIANLSEEEILNYAMERPGHPGQYGFMLQIQSFKSEEEFAGVMHALMARIGKIDNLKDKMQN